MAKKKTVKKTTRPEPEDFSPEEPVRDLVEPIEGMQFFTVEVPGVPGCPYLVMAVDEANAWETFIGCTGVRATDHAVEISPYAEPVYEDTARLGDDRYTPPLTRAKERIQAAKGAYPALSPVHGA